MRIVATVQRMLSRIRIAPSLPPESRSSGTSPGRKQGKTSRAPRAHAVLPLPPPRPALAEQAPALAQLEQNILERFRPQMRQALQDEVNALAAAEKLGSRPICCGRTMSNHDTRKASCLAWMGGVQIRARRYRCEDCGKERRPLLEQLEVEPGQPSGLLARLLGLLGCVASYSLAAEMALHILGVKVNAMTVWRAVQRLGEAAARHTEAVSAYHAHTHSEPGTASHASDAVVVAVDGCSLGMQVRSRRRHRKSTDEALPALPPVEDGHFREVKTGVLLRPAERVLISPGRRALVRRVLVTCLGDADALFNRVWAQLRELGWLGAHTVVVVVGDGSEWIWNRASMFTKRYEILDFWHAIEYAWAYARSQYGEGSRGAHRWVHRISQDLKAGKVKQVIARLKRLHPRSDDSKQALAALIKYYTDHASRMRYDECLRLGYGIGSGSVESAHKQVVHARMRQAGMRWSEHGARRLLALRLLLLNRDWETVNRLRMVSLAAA